MKEKNRQKLVIGLKILLYIALSIGVAFILLFIGFVGAALLLGGAQWSHVGANVPAKEHFDEYMHRDLSEFVLEEYGIEGQLSYDLIYDHPSQSGVAYPKYYVWLSVESEDGSIEGVARVAAKEKIEFDVFTFYSISDILDDPQEVCENWGESLCEEVKYRAAESLLVHE